MVYGLNGIYSSNRVNWDNSGSINEDLKFEYKDCNFLTENISYAILNDDMSLLEYCNENSESEVLSESVKDVVGKVVEAIKSMAKRIKEFILGMIDRLKGFISKVSFKTDKNGKFKPNVLKAIQLKVQNRFSKSNNESAVITERGFREIGGGFRDAGYYGGVDERSGGNNKKYETLYDLADELLPKEIEISSSDMETMMWMAKLNINWFSYYSENCRQIIKEINGLLKDWESESNKYGKDVNTKTELRDEYKEEFSKWSDKMKNKTDKLENSFTDISKEANGRPNYNLDNIRFSKNDIKTIITVSELDSSAVSKTLKSNLDDTLQLLQQYQKDLNSIGLKSSNSELENESITLYKEYTANAISRLTNILIKIYTRYSTQFEKGIMTAIRVRRELERILEWEKVQQDVKKLPKEIGEDNNRNNTRKLPHEIGGDDIDKLPDQISAADIKRLMRNRQNKANSFPETIGEN